uniref:Uncharacterized protein n=1 Tax=Rhizophora mucronata TaxID=61149 RepID=A0A2P2IQR1_RHIMU
MKGKKNHTTPPQKSKTLNLEENKTKTSNSQFSSNFLHLLNNQTPKRIP